MLASRKLWTALLLALGLLVHGAARAELYKWVDDEGNTIYSQVPPPDRDATRVPPPPPPPDNPTPPLKLNGDKDEEGTATAPTEEEKRVDKEIARVAKKNCEIARRNMDIYKTFGRVRNDKGEVIDLDDKTRAAKLKEAEQQIKDFCK